MKLLTNPLFLKMAILLFTCGFAFVVGLILVRGLRKNLREEASVPQSATTAQIPLHAYHAVIQELKQQKQELSSRRDAENRHAKTTENIAAAVLSKLPIGVLFFGENGLVRQANPSAKTILGIASPTAMDAASIFAKSTPVEKDSAHSLGEGIRSALLQGTGLQEVEAESFTPSGERRIIAVTALRVPTSDGKAAGVACLIEDRTEITELRRRLGQQLSSSRDPERTVELSADVVSGAKHFDQAIEELVSDNRNAKTASSHS